ncbi:MAG: signal recognition particle receptor subunit alpha, partial [Pseudomonadota bacterium]
MKLFAKFSRGLAKTSRQLGSRITTLFGQDRLDADTMQALEDALIQADLGPKLAQDLVAELVQNHAGKPDARQLREKLCELLYARIKPCEKPFDPSAETGHPAVVLVIGVNGAGKTTSIGKLASLMKQRQKRILVCAADTFRAAGGQQMRLWAERAAVDLIEGRQGSDAAAAVYESCARAREQGYDLLLIDTAGRLHTRRDLMDELAKINRVIEKQIPDAPHET